MKFIDHLVYDQSISPIHHRDELSRRLTELQGDTAADKAERHLILAALNAIGRTLTASEGAEWYARAIGVSESHPEAIQPWTGPFTEAWYRLRALLIRSDERFHLFRINYPVQARVIGELGASSTFDALIAAVRTFNQTHQLTSPR